MRIIALPAATKQLQVFLPPRVLLVRSCTAHYKDTPFGLGGVSPEPKTQQQPQLVTKRSSSGNPLRGRKNMPPAKLRFASQKMPFQESVALAYKSCSFTGALKHRKTYISQMKSKSQLLDPTTVQSVQYYCTAEHGSEIPKIKIFGLGSARLQIVAHIRRNVKNAAPAKLHFCPAQSFLFFLFYLKAAFSNETNVSITCLRLAVSFS